MSNHEIKTIVAELQSMSPRTQLEIVRLCKRVAELTPDYIEQLSQEDYAEFVSLVNQLRAELQAEIDTTNSNLTDATESLQAAIDAINSSIRNITFDTTENKTRITGTLKTSIIEANRIIDDDSQILFGTNQGLVFKQGTHTMNYDDDGLLWLDGIQIQPVPPTPTISLYQHNIILKYTNNFELSLIIYSNNSTPFDYDSFKNYMVNNNFGSNKLPVSGYVVSSGTYYNAFALTHALPNTFNISYNTSTASMIQAVNYGSPNYEITDYVIEI